MDAHVLAKHLLLGDDVLDEENVHQFICESYHVEVDKYSSYSGFNKMSMEDNYILDVVYCYVGNNQKGLADLRNKAGASFSSSHPQRFYVFLESDLLNEEPDGNYFIYKDYYISKGLFSIHPKFEIEEKYLVNPNQYQTKGFNDTFELMPMKELIITKMNTRFVGSQEDLQKFVNPSKDNYLYLFYTDL